MKVSRAGMRLAPVVVLLAVAALAAGCGSKKENAAPTAPPGFTPGQTPYGTWTRDVSDQDLERAQGQGGGGGAATAGSYTVVFSRGTMKLSGPDGSQTSEKYTLKGSTLEFTGSGGGGGGTLCSGGGSATYIWKKATNSLTLTAKNDTCGNRKAILTGGWRRAK